MSLIKTISNRFIYAYGKGEIDLSSDVFKSILMSDGFVFDPDTHGTYADVSGEEISSTGGYTTGGITLTVDEAWQQDNTNNQASIHWDDIAFIATENVYDDFCASIIIDTTHADTIVVGAIELGLTLTADMYQAFNLINIGFEEIDYADI